MSIVSCLTIGYFLGSLNPAALFGRLKRVDLRETGTKNLGASNAMQTLGRGYGAIVMVLDILKAYLAGRIVRVLYPHLAVAAMVAGLGAVVGHVFPFYMHFRGGKGLAAFGGMVCAYRPSLLWFYLTVGVALMILSNRTVFLPMFASFTFPLVVLFETGSLEMFFVCAAAAALVIWRHWENLFKVKQGVEVPLRELIRTKVLHRK